MVYLIWLVGFYSISTFEGYLKPNPFLYKYSVLFQTIQFSISTQFNKTFLFQTIQFSQTVLIQKIYFSVSIVSMSKTVLFQTIRFCICTQFKYQNSFISTNSV